MIDLCCYNKAEIETHRRKFFICNNLIYNLKVNTGFHLGKQEEAKGLGRSIDPLLETVTGINSNFKIALIGIITLIIPQS